MSVQTLGVPELKAQQTLHFAIVVVVVNWSTKEAIESNAQARSILFHKQLGVARLYLVVYLASIYLPVAP